MDREVQPDAFLGWKWLSGLLLSATAFFGGYQIRDTQEQLRDLQQWRYAHQAWSDGAVEQRNASIASLENRIQTKLEAQQEVLERMDQRGSETSKRVWRITRALNINME